MPACLSLDLCTLALSVCCHTRLPVLPSGSNTNRDGVSLACHIHVPKAQSLSLCSCCTATPRAQSNRNTTLQLLRSYNHNAVKQTRNPAAAAQLHPQCNQTALQVMHRCAVYLWCSCATLQALSSCCTRSDGAILALQQCLPVGSKHWTPTLNHGAALQLGSIHWALRTGLKSWRTLSWAKLMWLVFVGVTNRVSVIGEFWANVL